MNQQIWLHDDQYLFRLTSTFGWDDAISLCDYLVLGIETSASNRRTNRGGGDSSHDHDNELDADEYFNDSLIGHQHHNEKSLQQWLRQAYAQLFYRDQWWNCSLHAANFVKPPLNVIEALFRVGRALWEHGSHFRGETPIWASLCKDGSTPFLGK